MESHGKTQPSTRKKKMNKLLTLSAIALAATFGLTGCIQAPPAPPPVTVTAEPEAPAPAPVPEPEPAPEPEPEAPLVMEDAYKQFVDENTTLSGPDLDKALEVGLAFCADLDAGYSVEETFNHYVTTGIGEDGTATDNEIDIMATVLGAAPVFLCPQHEAAAKQFYDSQ